MSYPPILLEYDTSYQHILNLKHGQMIQYLQALKFFLYSLVILTFSSNILAQNRSFDGYGNNLEHPEWGAVGTNQQNLAPKMFADGVSEPAGIDRPNPRFISNTIFNQDGLLEDVLILSDYAFVWGQFIDHDITLVGDNHQEMMTIEIPKGDPYFDPFATGDAIIPIPRNVYDENTGTSPSNPREYPTQITAFIDASNVYGSSNVVANWLRTFKDGKLKMSIGNLLPYNTTTGEKIDPIDPSAPFMAMATPFPKYFVAGDIRANENILLTTMHTMFAREHNRLCDDFKKENPTMSDEELYQKARKTVGALLQNIVYYEWLPSMGLHLGLYKKYDEDLNPGIFNEFSAAAYRYGHTVINSKIVRMNNDGELMPSIHLKDAFFNPNIIVETGGIDPFLIGMGTQVEQDFDCKMIHDLRNFLFGAPGQGGMDLASINIQRGRERGLADYNTIRQSLGMPKLVNFSELSEDPWFNQIFESVYRNINDVDPWVGFLAESHMDNALFGETVMNIMFKQFRALRDGDRFYFENDPAFTKEEIAEIRKTTLKDIIMRNTGVKVIQDNVFLMAPHQITGISNKEESTIELAVYPNPVTNNLYVNMSVPAGGDVTIQITDVKGVVVERLVEKADIGMNTFEFNLDSELPAGIYLITLVMENRVGHRRIYKN